MTALFYQLLESESNLLGQKHFCRHHRYAVKATSDVFQRQYHRTVYCQDSAVAVPYQSTVTGNVLANHR